MTWADLEPLLIREGIARESPQVADRLRDVASAANSAGRSLALAAVAATLTDGNARRLFHALAADSDAAPRRLALDLAARLPRLPEPALIPRLRPLLRDRRIPATVRLAAAVTLVRYAGPSEVNLILHDFAAGYGRLRFLQRRSALRKRFRARVRSFDRFAAKLGARMPFGCPRCGIKLRRTAMARHLWERHHRLLAGRRVRSPWRLIDLWAAAPGGSPINAHRQIVRAVGEDANALAALRLDARGRHAGLCPQCFAAVSLDPAIFSAETDISALNLSHGRLSGDGFILELTETLAGPQLRIETPPGTLFRGPEPNPLTLISGRRLASFPLAAAAMILAVTVAPPWTIPATLVTLLAAAWLTIVLRTGAADDRSSRIIDQAWRELAPTLHADGFDPVDGDFLIRLANVSQWAGDPLGREQALKQMIAVTQAAIKHHSARPIHLIALQRLLVSDATATGGDPVVILADAVRPCLTGEMSPAAADLLLRDELFRDWTRGQRARLRVLIATRAFTARVGVWDLHALGRAVPGLGRVLNSDDTDGLARLRLLWDLRPTRPWQHCGPAATVFELAKYPMLGGQHLEAAPDLLLFQPLPAGGEPIHLLACGRGLIVDGALIHHWPTRIDTRPLPGSKGGGYELRFGSKAIQVHGDVKELTRKLEAWGSYFFKEFLPWIGNALSRSQDGAPERLAVMRVACPECGTTFLGKLGEVGRPDFANSSRPPASDSA